MRMYLLPIIFLMITVASCDMIEYHPYDTDLDETHLHLNSKNIGELSRVVPRGDTIRFVWTGDTQRWYEETQAFVDAVNERDDIDFVLHGGDLTDYGMKQEYIWMDDMLKCLNIPYMVVVGNHDMVGLGQSIYECIYGSLNFSFIYNKTKFICLNTNVLGLDYTLPVPDFDFIKSEVADSISFDYDQTIVVFHAAPGGSEFNNNVGDYFNESINESKNLMFCLHAHAHRLQERDIFNDGTIYYGCDDMESRTYMLFTMIGSDYSFEIVSF